MKTIICQVCGTTKRVQDSNVGKFCSRTCKSAAAERIEVECLGCGQLIVKLKSQDRGTKYCSNECRLQYKQQARTRVCGTCGKEFAALKPDHRFCSRACIWATIPAPNSIDGRSFHPQYNRWYNMMVRCTKPDNPMYPNYGARGISVCEEWHDPFVFYQYLEQMGPCPEGHSLDRINNNGNYEPGNVRWASPKEQRANSRDPWLTRQR